jgi:hypothetical protein
MDRPLDAPSSSQREELCLRAARSSYVVFGVMFGGLMIFLAVVAL